MNKKEFIETLMDMGGCGAEPKSWARGWDEAISEVLGIAEDLDEPGKVVIPQFVIKRGPEAGGISAEELNRILKDKTHDYDSERYEKHRNLVDELHEIYVAKNKDYGNSFGESVDEFGIIAGVIRIGDKYNRLKTLARGHDPLVNDESMIDTLKDMANYCLLTVIELEEEK